MSALEGRTALVTGASSGIGAAVARRLADEGARVAVCARRLDRLEALAGEVARDGGEVLPVRADLRREDDIARMFAEVRESLGGVDVLVNNAGLGRPATLLSGETGAWREMLDVNVVALCVCTREAVRDMRRRDVAGHVVNLSSMSAHRVAGNPVYAATKHAVKALTEGLRRELREAGSPIRVTAVSPGFVETEFARHYTGSEEGARETYDRFPCLQPEDVADLVAFAVTRPPHVQLHDLLVRPTEQPT
ncbi:MAG: SDR family NAD(P)-dependent oxidoreductase [Myxococcota bacterium]